MVYNKHVLAAQLCTRTDVLSALTGMLDILNGKKKNPMGSWREQTYELKWTRTRNRELAPSAWLQLTPTFQKKKKLYRSSHAFHYFRVFIKISQWSVQDAGSGMTALLLPLPEYWQSSNLIQLLLLNTFATHHRENTITSSDWSMACLRLSYWNSSTGRAS